MESFLAYVFLVKMNLEWDSDNEEQKFRDDLCR